MVRTHVNLDGPMLRWPVQEPTVVENELFEGDASLVVSPGLIFQISKIAPRRILEILVTLPAKRRLRKVRSPPLLGAERVTAA